MTRTTAARAAGFTLLFYIAVGISSMGGAFHGPAADLARYAQNASAAILALTLFVVTRVEQPAVAALGMIFRVAEGGLGPFLALTGITLARPTLAYLSPRFHPWQHDNRQLIETWLEHNSGAWRPVRTQPA